jgi:GLPGLI family protein
MSIAQDAYTITYSNSLFYVFDSAGNPLITNPRNLLTKLVINDHQSYYYTYQVGNNYYNPKTPMGKKFLPHSDYTNKTEQKVISQFGNEYRVVEKLIIPNWQLSEEKQSIAGFNCNKAILKTDKDSLIAWYTEKLPSIFGPYLYRGLPGTILETTLFRSDNIYRITAILVEEKTNPIVIPKKGKLITWEEWQKMMQVRRSIR